MISVIINKRIFTSVVRSFILLLPCSLSGQPVANGEWSGHAEEGHNMALVGYHDLQGRPAYQPEIVQQGDRWIAYVGLIGGKAMNDVTGVVESNGTIIVDVTDPHKPVTLSQIPGSEDEANREGSGAQMNRVCTINGKTFLLRSFGSSRHELWDVTVPREPAFVINVADDIDSVHKNWWECDTGIAYIVAGDKDWRSRYTRIYDLSDPAHPVFIRNYGMPGQQPGSDIEPVPTDLHGPIVQGNRVYFGYGSSRDGIIQIVDRDKLLNGSAEPTTVNLEAPEIGRYYLAPNYGAHTVFPVLGLAVADYSQNTEGSVRDFLIVPSESTRNQCLESRDVVFIIDISFPDKPIAVSSYQVRESDGNFCQRGGRFGPHAVNESTNPMYYKKIVFVSYFNAGVRAVDIRDPYRPEEVGYFIPATTADTTSSCLSVNGNRQCRTAVQTNNVEIDDRGYIYIVDRNSTGMHILELTGAAKAIAGIR